jgi:hypothetical protein
VTVNYREVQDRFSHIDAGFVGAEVNLSGAGGQAAVTVRFYPWWEHPGYLAARDNGTPWGFSAGAKEGTRSVVVRALTPVAARISRRELVIDWLFSENHPLLWQFSEQIVLYVNGRFDVRELIDRVLGLGLPSVTRQDLRRYFDPSMGPLQSRGIMLPAQLCDCTVRCLTEMNVAVLPYEQATPPKLTAFVMDGDDYIVAEDFVLDVPDFEHRPEWFAPAGL